MITLHIPKNGILPDLKKELMSAKKIKDRVTRNNTISGLNKISQYI